jgi:GAF domain-containing protein
VSPTDQPDNDQVYERLQGLLLSAPDIESFLTELARMATTVVDSPISCGITLRYEKTLLTVGSSDARAELLDETQYHHDVGPCLEAMRTDQVVDSGDTATESRWPSYTSSAVEAGLRCSLSLPMTAGSETFGALNLYGFERPHLFQAPQRETLQIFAAHAAQTLRLASRRITDTAALAEMEEALRSRTVIDQALGVTMAQRHCTADEAFDILRHESEAAGRRITEIAEELLARTSGPAPHGDGADD